MADENVVTRYSAQTSGFESAMGRLGGLASAGARAIGSVVSALNPLNLALGAGGIGVITSRVVALNDQFESTRRTIGGALSALGVVGGADPTAAFRNGLRAAEGTMLAINAAAARLPGEAEDYVSVFQTALPDLQAGIGNNVRDIYTFTNRLTAVGRTFGLDSVQIGMDARRLFAATAGRAGNEVQTWNRLLPFLKQVQGHANLTSEEFNRMTNVERIDLFRQAMVGLQPMLDDAGDSWDSQFGAIKSAGNLMLRLSGQPLFEGLKNRLKSINGLIMDSDGNLTAMGQRIVSTGQQIANHFVRGFEVAAGAIDQMRRAFAQFSTMFQASPAFRFLSQGINNLSRIGGAVRGAASNFEGGGGGAGGGGGMSSRLMDAIGTQATNLSAAFASLTTMVGPAVRLFGAIGGVLAEFYAAYLPAFSGVVREAAAAIANLWNAAAPLVTSILGQIRPALSSLAQGIASLTRGALGTMIQTIRIVARVFLWFYQQLWGVFGPAIRFVIDMIGQLASFIGTMLQKLTGWLASFLDEPAHNVGHVPPRGTSGAGTQPPVTPPEEPPSGTTAAAEAAAARRGGGGRSTIDARYSRFEINQKFEEGFDPDRIALAFVRDVGRLGQERLQSGLEPAFGVV